MSYDLVIERPDGELFDRREVEAAIAVWPHLRRYDAESYRSGGSEVVLVAERPGLPVDSVTLRIFYESLPQGFDTAADVAFGLAERLGGQVVDAQLGEVITPENREVSRAKAEEAARWVRRLGAEFEEPARAYVDEPAAAVGGGGDGGRAGDDDGGRPWWKFWARD